MVDGALYKVINAKILRDHALVENDYVWFQNGKFVDAQTNFFKQRKEADHIIDAEGAIVAPGYLDIQINGSYGIDFADYEESVEKIKQDIDKVAKGLLQDGCKANAYSEILGAHVEGPFISHEKKGKPKKKKAGAHDDNVIRDARRGLVDFDEAYGPELKNQQKAVCILTLAPEIDGVLDCIPQLQQRGITVSLGHSAAHVKAAEAGVANGANLMTHLFNAMLPFHQRDPGMVGILGATDLPAPRHPNRHPSPSFTSPGRHLPDPRPFYGIICDGIHVHPNSVRIAYYSHPKGCILVTDALSASGLPPGRYQLGGQDIEVRHGGAYLVGTDTLAGSTVTIDQCVRNFRRFTRCSVVEALEAATLHPALALGIADRKGSLVPGADADMVFLDNDLNLKRVFVRGEEVDLVKHRK
ncbi:Metallo-dependent hydrolase [Hesseltinella vesiculosa]|uniref:N-acetylglucosamine-6-phosphate deacetylase n=1 Tax=Hesseltinella vesiculosa TaxID=101127 RepID=A0A1X2GJN9_9FUNG|nr:Metallo-dependent hydrolase [Hesseltinella vesiculosa]ORX54528.1 Metallo-dependent hydrolase [Hesseltinella vesiculosa]